jgi:NAD+ synthase
MSLVPRLPDHAERTIHQFLRSYRDLPEKQGFVLGLSGGIDSALVLRLTREAVGHERILAVLLPDRRFPEALRTETAEYAQSLGVATRQVEIDALEEAAQAALPDVQDRVWRGNIRARSRMLVLYALANAQRRLVVGTGNKSELLLGYFTKYGDGGVDVLPIGDLYKTQVRELAEQLGLPRRIRERLPTAGFWEGQSDEGELGLSYAILDQILVGVEQLRGESEIARLIGQPLASVSRVVRRVEENRHKRRTPPIPKISLRTIGIDWRD